ncbi:HpsJ family protein [Pseudanabaena sp. FACHB-2040]|uniref:hormogonium polysaccharide biosynthesis protein HpsJ n=1 Tax=Pseudanabaena sp. FACHB-2040 TaxID=2692859 RepID=UPI001F549DAC|nr:HpsJ family protein [Pseudanabaena sp. FACHB-2040]
MSPLAAIALKLVGIVTIVSALLDYLILLIPPNLTNPQWQLATTTQIVDRGIVPLVGIALLLTGFWIDNSVGRAVRGRNLVTDLRFWACLLGSFLGLVYLILAILHVNNVRLTSQQALSQVGNEANQATTQLEQQLSTELTQQQTQLSALLENETLLQQAIQSGQLPQDIEQFRNNPEALNQFLQQRADEAQQRLQTEIGSRRQQAEQRVRTEAWKSGLRISLSSLILAIGYSVIGWIGLRRLMSLTRS